jgi:hypothetical protein
MIIIILDVHAFNVTLSSLLLLLPLCYNIVIGILYVFRRSRRRSGSGLVRVGSEIGTLEKKRAVDDVTGETLDTMVMMTSLDNGPHRERAVDVPDSFIARKKTPPRYPPPSRANRNTGTQV